MGKSSPWGKSSPKIDTFQPPFWPSSPNLPYFRPIFALIFQIFEAPRALFRGEEIQKSKSGGGKNPEEFELYLPVQEFQKKKMGLIQPSLTKYEIKWPHLCHIIQIEAKKSFLFFLLLVLILNYTIGQPGQFSYFYHNFEPRFLIKHFLIKKKCIR